MGSPARAVKRQLSRPFFSGLPSFFLTSMTIRAVPISIRTAVAALACAMATGCSSGAVNALSGGSETVDMVWQAQDAGATDDGPTSPPPASPRQGSPLCNASRFAGSCYPDDPATAKGCGPAPD